MKKRLRLTENTYSELVEAWRWCQAKGFNGLAQWYDELLTFHAKRGALPIERQREYELRNSGEEA